MLVCKKLYAQSFGEESVIESAAVLPNYNGDDWHKMYIGEILEVLKK